MKFRLLLLLSGIFSTVCYSQGHIIAQDRKGNVFATNVATQTSDTFERRYADRIVGGAGVSSNTVRVFYLKGHDTVTKDYSITLGTLQQRKPAFILSKRGAEMYTYTCTYAPSYIIKSNVVNGSLYVYKNGDLLSSIQSDYKGLMSAYVTYTPTDIDIASGTLLIEQEISPIRGMYGNVKTSVKEISFMTGEELWSSTAAAAAFYSPAKDYINFTGNYSKGSSRVRASYVDRKTKKVHVCAPRCVSFWL
jgi:hypothetical protein